MTVYVPHPRELASRAHCLNQTDSFPREPLGLQAGLPWDSSRAERLSHPFPSIEGTDWSSTLSWNHGHPRTLLTTAAVGKSKDLYRERWGRQKGLWMHGLTIPASCLLRATAGSRESIQAEKMVVREPLSQEGQDGRVRGWGVGGVQRQGNSSRNSLTLKNDKNPTKGPSVTPSCAPQNHLKWTLQHPLAEEPCHSEGPHAVGYS